MCISFFEVLPEYRGDGYGTEIIKQFLSTLSKYVYLTPQNDEVITFWEKCGFEGDATMFYRN